MNIFKPVKRIMSDGSKDWVVYNTLRDEESQIYFFHTYKTRKACQYAIDKFNKSLEDILSREKKKEA